MGQFGIVVLIKKTLQTVLMKKIIEVINMQGI